MDADEARALAESLLSDALPDRWRHSQSVAAAARRLAGQVEVDARVVVSAAWLHDIGYAPGLADTGFHPIDGARHLEGRGWPRAVVALVAHHSCSRIEAGARRLSAELTAFPDVEGLNRDILWASDATTGPTGATVSLEDRVADVLNRYGAESLVGRCMVEIEPELRAAIDRVSRCRADRWGPGRARRAS